MGFLFFFIFFCFCLIKKIKRTNREPPRVSGARKQLKKPTENFSYLTTWAYGIWRLGQTIVDPPT